MKYNLSHSSYDEVDEMRLLGIFFWKTEGQLELKFPLFFLLF